MTWLFVAILAYLILAAVNLVDKHLLSSSIPNPKVYVFYVGVLFVSVSILAPFTGFYIPNSTQIIMALFSGAIFVMGLFWFYKALNQFEASRVIPVVGGLTPLFTFGLVYLFSRAQENIAPADVISFLFLTFGSVLMVFEKNKLFNLKTFGISAVSALFISLSFVSAKYVYLDTSFWTGFIWRSWGGFLTAVCFFFIFPEVRKEIFRKREKTPRKSAVVFLANQAAGGGAAILQNWAIALAPLIYVAFINALQGVQYAFLLVFSIFLSLRFPKILREEISKKILFQKIIAILIIGGGLAILAF